MAQNIIPILTQNQRRVKNIVEIRGYCSKIHVGNYENLSICKRCQNLVCKRCINNIFNKCVECYGDLSEKWCENCGELIWYRVCKICGELIEYCHSNCILYRAKYIFNGWDLHYCKSCKKN